MKFLPDLRSDNLAPALNHVLEALASDHGMAFDGGQFGQSRFLEPELDELVARRFDHAAWVIPVVTGTAANALALAALVPQDGVVFCHEEAHIRGWEEEAYAFFSRGTRLVALSGPGARIDLSVARNAIERFRSECPDQVAAISVTQVTERGTVYSVGELRALFSLAHAWNIGVHMDGARFAQAVVALDVHPAELTWRAGVDVLSLGTSKLGSLCAESVIGFARVDRGSAQRTAKRAGHRLSKRRDLAVQIMSMLEADRWLTIARHTNRLAKRLAEGLQSCGLQIAEPVQANQVFFHLAPSAAAAVAGTGLPLLEWTVPGMYRFVTAHHHTDQDVEHVIDLFKTHTQPKP